MKVGTDGVLLGAWASHPQPYRILDIGSGSGLISLMLAQRYPLAQIDAIDADYKAFQQSELNFHLSGFTGLRAFHNRLQEFIPDTSYDLIVSNPPFFAPHFRSTNEARNTARLNDSLDLNDIFYFSRQHLNPNGRLALIYPTSHPGNPRVDEGLDWHLQRLTRVCSTPLKEPHRDLHEWSLLKSETVHQQLIIENSRHHYTDEFKSLVKDFYLHL